MSAVSRDEHYKWLKFYKGSNREYAEHCREIGTLAPGVDPSGLPSLLGVRWEISREIFEDFLNLLPPMRWRRGESRESFLMSEFIFGSITTKYTREGHRYYCEFVDARKS